MTYIAPIQDIQFSLKYIADYDSISNLDGNEEFGWDLVDAVLEESAKLAGDVIAPLNRSGDVEGAHRVDGKVRVPHGWKKAFDAVAEGGWIGLSADPEHGGQGLPDVIGAAVNEMWQASNLAFSLCNMLTQGVMRTIELCASDDLKQTYLPKMMAGTWTGTMNLTEPQAGSDLAAIRTKAQPNGDHYLISGQKIFITYGDHEMAENIAQLVLARTPDAPAGVKGISLFIVPKFLVNEDGSLGERNDYACVSLEEKLGIHASPTAVMSYGDNGGAAGYLVGEENRGLEYMFIMMNQARFDVGLQGLAVADRAYQQAVAYAKERVQGPAIGRSEKSAIIGHPDVRRMLLSMKSRVEAMRCLAYWAASHQDHAAKAQNEEEINSSTALFEYLTPIVKGWLTETGQDITSVGVQVHGGVGFIEETGAAQLYRDSRITTIYEGTTGIQANDLAFRKTLRDNGTAANQVMQEMRTIVAKVGEAGEWGSSMALKLADAVDTMEEFLDWVLKRGRNDPAPVSAAADAYLRAMGTLIGGGLLLKSAVIAESESAAGNLDSEFTRQKIETATFFANSFFPQVKAWCEAGRESSGTVVSFEDDWF